MGNMRHQGSCVLHLCATVLTTHCGKNAARWRRILSRFAGRGRLRKRNWRYRISRRNGQVSDPRSPVGRAMGSCDSVLLFACGIAQVALRRRIRWASVHPVSARSQRGSFPSGGAALKLLYVTTTKAAGQQHMAQNWKPVLSFLGRACPERICEALARNGGTLKAPTCSIAALTRGCILRVDSAKNKSPWAARGRMGGPGHLLHRPNANVNQPAKR